MSAFAAVPGHALAAASWRWMAMAGTVAGIGIAAASWQPSQPIPPAGAPSAAPPAAAHSVVAIAQRDPGRRIEVIAQLAPGAPAAALARRAGGVVVQRLGLIDGVVVRLSAAGALRLATEPGVHHVSLNAAAHASAVTVPTQQLATAYPESIRASKAWNTGMRATGKGVTVAVLDTGIAGGLPDFLGADGKSRVIASATVHPDATTAADGVGHGTHVAGLIAGNGTMRGGALKGKYIGSAPDANLVSVKISDDRGDTTLADVISGLQFVVEQKDALGIRVVNLSLNSTVAEPAATDPLDAAAEVAWANGLVVVTASGNRGTAPDATWYAPANDPFVITVGAVDDGGSKGLNDDTLTNWSSRGPTQAGLEKPDVLAPGSQLVAPLAPSAGYARECPACVTDGEYLRLGGTSMSAAVASGAVADILQVHPDWTPDQVKGALTTGVRNTPGAGFEVQVDRAAQLDGSIVANTNATPSTLLPARTEFATLADWTRMSFTRMSFTRMSFTTVPPGDPLNAAWSRMSFTCDCRPTEAEAQRTLTAADGAQPAPDGTAPAPLESTVAQDTTATAVDESRMSFTRMSFTRMSFTTSFTK